MASIFEKKPFFKSTHEWDTKTKFNEVYKLQSNDLCNKYKAEIPKDSGSLGIEFTLDRTITDFIHGAKGSTWTMSRASPSSATCSRAAY
jgi:hypothetical protein